LRQQLGSVLKIIVLFGGRTSHVNARTACDNTHRKDITKVVVIFLCYKKKNQQVQIV
jgi:hypothetical protein